MQESKLFQMLEVNNEQESYTDERSVVDIVTRTECDTKYSNMSEAIRNTDQTPMMQDYFTEKGTVNSQECSNVPGAVYNSGWTVMVDTR